VGRVPDIGPRARIAFAVAWLLGQGVLVFTSGSRPDHIFGFRMFPEASQLQIRLARLTESGERPALDGEWSALDSAGQLRHFSFRDRVRDPVLGSLDTRVFAAYGADTQLARLQRAIDDLAEHTPEDAETLRFVAHVSVWRNGREAVTYTLQSALRGRAR
jgi:hypothetical protein